ncbi:OmpP1/FadL family transporter [Geofilum sp. OHC36d9]|uniref:OmpP1/FadL family transporter n=1 Tax=Geofilum sp. OHC36d9 TaxID=3458413 RepID=UPI004033B0C2
MKRIPTILSILSIASIGLMAQNTDDALRLSLTRPSGTARSISLGGALGALGGDYSGIGINPAGIAVYRSSEFTFTPSLHLNQTSSDYYGYTGEEDKYSFPLQQIGYVATYKPMHETTTGLISTHFAIGYSRNNSFKKNTFIQGNGIYSSLLDEFVYSADGLSNNQLDARTGLAYDSFLMDPLNSEAIDDPNISTGYYHAFEDLDGEGNPQWGPTNGINQRRLLTEKGNGGDFDLSFGANFSNTFYLGGTLGIATFNYKKEMQHYEEPTLAETPWTYLENYTYKEKLNTSGLGVNLKVGVIYKPTSSLRIGAAFHSPTYYSVDEEYSYHTYLPQGFGDYSGYDSPYGEYSYNFNTPYKAIGSAAYTFGNKGLISVDYEYTDYASMQFKSKEGSIDDMEITNWRNDNIKDTFKATHNIRVGGEYKPTETFSLRAGYGYFQSPYNKDYINNDDSYQTFSGGFGYRMNNMFVDVAYRMRLEKNTYSLYYSGFVAEEDQEPASITSKLHQIAVTLGWRF